MKNLVLGVLFLGLLGCSKGEEKDPTMGVDISKPISSEETERRILYAMGVAGDRDVSAVGKEARTLQFFDGDCTTGILNDLNNGSMGQVLAQKGFTTMICYDGSEVFAKVAVRGHTPQLVKKPNTCDNAHSQLMSLVPDINDKQFIPLCGRAFSQELIDCFSDASTVAEMAPCAKQRTVITDAVAQADEKPSAKTRRTIAAIIGYAVGDAEITAAGKRANVLQVDSPDCSTDALAAVVVAHLEVIRLQEFKTARCIQDGKEVAQMKIPH